jgi:hypothetical protein
MKELNHNDVLVIEALTQQCCLSISLSATAVPLFGHPMDGAQSQSEKTLQDTKVNFRFGQ